jgi:1-acyl-sn-glycerol-3-phosphate acyltransferase
MPSAKPTKVTKGAAGTKSAGGAQTKASASGVRPDERGAPRRKAPARTATKTATKTVLAKPATVRLPVDHDDTAAATSLALVPVPKPDPEPVALPDPRRSDVDEWGRSEHMRELARQMYEPMYRTWHRVEWEGLDKIPTTGGALLVSNHAGAIPADAPAIMHGIETELGRPVYGLADEMFKRMPVVGTMWSRVGGVLAHPDNAYRLLREQDQLALVFPEGTKGTGKTYSERYQLRRFGRGGFVQIAMRAGVPIVPIAVVGAEEAMPIIWKSPQLAKLLGIPYFPITANMLALGPLGALLHFPAKIKIRVLDPVHFDVEPDQPRYSRSRIMEESEAIRQRIQDALYDMLRARESVWFG